MTQLNDVLTRIAEQARPAYVGPDTWRKGRRRRRVWLGGVACLVVLLAATPLLVLRAPAAHLPGDGARRIVPSTVYSPITGEDTIVESPPGPAAILVSGDHELRGSDIWGWEGRSLLVAQDGRYRLVRTVGEASAGLGAGQPHLSPDGRYIAANPSIEGGTWPNTNTPQTAVIDLTTGELKQYDGGEPIGWAPDGRSILVQDRSELFDVGTLRLLDLASGRARDLPSISGTIHVGNFTAFSPDGTRLAVATTDALYIVDLRDDTVSRLADLNSHRRLAGPGAWHPDGTRIAMYFVGGCVDGPCGERKLAARLFQMEFVEVSTGRVIDGQEFASPPGLAARLLGWQRDGAAVVAVYSLEDGVTKPADDANWSETDWWTVGGVELLRFSADGKRRPLVELPEGALFVDVPANLMDSFGGPSPNLVEGAVRWLLALYWPLGQFVVAIVVAVVIVLLIRRRRRRRRRRRLSGRLDPLEGAQSSR